MNKIAAILAAAAILVCFGCGAEYHDEPIGQDYKFQQCESDANSYGYTGGDKWRYIEDCMIRLGDQDTIQCSKTSKERGLRGAARRDFMRDCLNYFK